jgi:spore maturation protein CgeB
MEKYFIPDTDFVAYQSVVDLADKMEYYSQNIRSANRIASQGHNTYRKLILDGEFWKQIDTCLEKPLKIMKAEEDA